MTEESDICLLYREREKGIALGLLGSFIKKTRICLGTQAGDCVCMHTYLFIQQTLSETFPYVRPRDEVDVPPALNEFTF